MGGANLWHTLALPRFTPGGYTHTHTLLRHWPAAKPHGRLRRASQNTFLDCVLILRGRGWVVGGWCHLPKQSAHGQGSAKWLRGGEANQFRVEGKKGAWHGTRASEGINTVWQAGWDRHTHTQTHKNTEWELRGRPALLSTHNTTLVLEQEEKGSW